MPGKFLTADPAELESQIKPQSFLGTDDPEDLDVRMGFTKELRSRDELNALPFAERQKVRLSQNILRFGIGTAERFVNLGGTVLDEALRLQDYIVNMMLTPDRLTEIHAEQNRLSIESGLGPIPALPKGAKFDKVKSKPIPRVQFIDAFEQNQLLIEPDIVEKTVQRSGEVFAELVGITAAIAATGATGIASYAVTGLGLGALTAAEARRDERLTGVKYGNKEILHNAMVSAGAGLAGGIAGGAIVAGVSKILARPLGEITKGIVSSTSLATIFEGAALIEEGVDLRSEEAVSRWASAVIGFNLAHLNQTLFVGQSKPITDEAKKRSFEITTEFAEQLDLGIRQQKGSKVSEDTMKRAGFEFARNWYQNVSSPVLKDVEVRISPNTLVETFGISMQEANRIVAERIPAEKIRQGKFETARLQMAEERGADAVTETKLRMGELDQISIDRWLAKRERMTVEEIDALVPKDAEVQDRLLSEGEFRDNIDGFGTRSIDLENRQRIAQEEAINQEFAGEPGFQVENEFAGIFKDPRGLIEFFPPEKVTRADLFPKTTGKADPTGGLALTELEARKRAGRGELIEEVPGEKVFTPRSVEDPSRLLEEKAGPITPEPTAKQQAEALARGERLEDIGGDAGPGRKIPGQVAEKPSKLGQAGEPKGRVEDRAQLRLRKREGVKQQQKIKRRVEAAERKEASEAAKAGKPVEEKELPRAPSEESFKKDSIKAQARESETLAKSAKESKKPLNRFEAERVDYIKKNPTQDPNEVRVGMGDVSKKESKQWAGVSKAFLGERTGWKRKYSGRPGKELFLKWLRKQDSEDFGGEMRKDRFIEEERAGGFSSKDTTDPANVNPKERTESVWESKPSARPMTPEEAEFYQSAKKLSPEENASLAETDRVHSRELEKGEADRPRLTPDEKNLPLILLGVASGAGVLSQMDEEQRELAAAMGLGMVGGLKRIKPKRAGKLPKVSENPVERWMANIAKRQAAEAKAAPPALPAAPRKGKPTKAVQAKVESQVLDAQAKVIKRIMRQGGEDVGDQMGNLERRKLGPFEKKMASPGAVTETFAPILTSMEFNFGPDMRVMRMKMNKALMRAQRDKRRADFFARDNGDWDIGFSKKLTPKNFAKNQARSDYDNLHDIGIQLHERIRRPVEIQEQITVQERRLSILGPKDPDRPAFKAVIQNLVQEQAAATQMKIDLPNSDKIAGAILGNRSKFWEMPYESILDAWPGYKVTPEVLKIADSYKVVHDGWMGGIKRQALAPDVQLPMVAYSKGPYGPANQARWTLGPEKSFMSKLPRGSKLWKEQDARARRATDLMIKNFVFRSRNNQVPMEFDAAKALLMESRAGVKDPFGVEPLDFVEGAFGKSKAKVEKTQGNLDLHRLVDIDIGVEMDLAKIQKTYVNPSIDRLSNAREFGPNGEIAKDLLRRTHMDGYDAVAAERLYNGAASNLTRRDVGNNSIILREFTGLVGIGTMAMSGISQLTSFTRSLAEGDMRSYAKSLQPGVQASISQSKTLRRVFPKAFIETFGSREWDQFTSEMGTMARSEAVSAMADIGGFTPPIAAFLIQGPYGTAPIDRLGRNIGGITGFFTTKKLLEQNQKLIQDGKRSKAETETHPYLKEIFGEFAGRDRNPSDPELYDNVLSGEYSPAELRQIATIGGQIIGDRSSGRTFAADMPLNARHPVFAPFYKLSQFAVRMTDETLRQLNPANPSSPVKSRRAFLRMLLGMAITLGVGHFGVRQARRLLGGQDPLTTEELFSIPEIKDSISYIGVAPIFLDGLGIVAGRYGPFAEQAAGPVYGKIIQFSVAGSRSVIHRDPRYIGRALLQSTPRGIWTSVGVPTPNDWANKAFPRKSTRKPSEEIPP